MKNLLYSLSLLLLLGACSSIEKLVEKGEYDRAIALGVKKLQGKKNKKTKYVKGLERAFKKITKRDMEHVSNLMERDNSKYWDEIFETYRAIEKRQRLIEPLLPLISKDGYQAKFKFVKTSGLKKEAADNAGIYYYNKGLQLLNSARNGDKLDARKAYDHFERIDKFKADYKDSEQLLEEAYELGQTRVLVKMKNSSLSILPVRFEQELFSFGVQNLDTRWVKFYSNKNNNFDFDVTAIYNIEHIEISPEKEIVNQLTENAEISDGWDYVLDSNGNVMKDSIGNDIKVERFKTISANVSNVILEKFIRMEGHLNVIELRDNRVILNKMLRGEALFDEHFSTFKGDKRALSKNTKKNLNDNPLYFPSDEALLMITAEKLKDELNRTLDKLFK